jgi:hypothetical protein
MHYDLRVIDLQLRMAKALRALSSKRPLRRGEERTLALLHHLRKLRDDWESKNTAESSATKSQQQIEELEVQLEKIQAESSLEQTTFGKAFTESKAYLIALGAAISLGVGVVTGSDQNSKSVAPLFYILALSGGVAALLKADQHANAKNRTVEQQTKRITELRQQLGSARKQYSEHSREVRANHTEIPSIVFGSALIPLENKNILGNNFIVDPTGLIKASQLKSIALRDLSGDANKILEITRKLEDIPVLLRPDQESLAESRQANNTLHGEERELKDAVGSYVNTLASITDEELSVHAIKPSSALGRALAEALSNNESIVKDTGVGDIATTLKPVNQQVDNEIRRFEDLQREAEAVSTVALTQLDQINSELKQLCQRYNRARRESTNTLHSNYYQVLNRASWCSKKYYCPRTILSKSYLQALIGLDLDRAHTLVTEQLVESLHSDSFISSRISNKPQIIDDLLRSHESIAEIIHTYQLVPDESGLVRAGAAADYIVDQYNQELSLFRQRLVEALTGSPNGFLGISESARLYYDPSRQLWSSPVLPYTYTNTDIEQYGQILRTDVDLLIPLWEHLWTEKADFRKSELFRTNESIQRMSEKEGEKIKQIGYQFQGDLREVRSNMFLAKADFDSKLQELEEYEEGVKELGLMDEGQLAKLQSTTSQLEAVSQETSGDASGYEQILMLEPKNQLLRRQSKVHDPIDVIKSPDLLIEGGIERGTRRLIHTDKQEASS